MPKFQSRVEPAVQKRPLAAEASHAARGTPWIGGRPSCSSTQTAIMIAVWVLLQDGLPPIHGVPLAAWLASAASGLFCTAGSTLLWNLGIPHVPASQIWRASCRGRGLISEVAVLLK